MAKACVSIPCLLTEVTSEVVLIRIRYEELLPLRLVDRANGKIHPIFH